ncbi:DUF7507 domain-containing protein [Acidaminobacter sp.]|uniref:DUF7507 domain-containing protein n=1 Tax=Acidaminobacter sp. TaxID=1872102 RepID=UPI002567E077|nr:Ig-like domain-containing protein [Acidaminobacter sp.]MDK9712390.1 Ig-like domain-containing protein [Acidaminobacter sp.]
MLTYDSLAPGATADFTASYTITQADLDAGSVTNTAYATDGTTESEPDSETVTAVPMPALTIVKTAAPATYDAVGDTISYSYVVTNTGNVTLYNVSVVDDKATTSPVSVDSLAPGATADFTASYTITQADLDAGSVTNTAYATDGTTESEPDSETVTAVPMPAITIDKSANPTNIPETGGEVEFTFLITNTGNVTLKVTSLNDDVFDDLLAEAESHNSDEDIVLAPGGTFSFSIKRTLSSGSPLLPHINTVTVKAVDDDANEASDFDDATVTFTDILPEITVTKSPSVDFVLFPGADVTFTVVISNTCEEEVTVTSIMDDKFGDLLATAKAQNGDTDIILAPEGQAGDSFTFTFVGYVSGNVGSTHTNTVTVRAYDDDENYDDSSDSAEVDIFLDPSLIKSVNGSTITGDITFPFEIRTGASMEDAPDGLGTTIATGTATAGNGGVVDFSFTGDYLTTGVVYQLVETVPFNYIPDFVSGTYGENWFKPTFIGNEGALFEDAIEYAVNFKVNPDASIDFVKVLTPNDVIRSFSNSISVNNSSGDIITPYTISFWKNHAAFASSQGNQDPVLDQTLFDATAAGNTVTIGLLELPGGTERDIADPSGEFAVNLLNKMTIDGLRKMASDPAFNLAAQLLAYRLNMVVGSTPIELAAPAADLAQEMLTAISFNGLTHDPISKELAANLNYLAWILDAYNNFTLTEDTLELPYPDPNITPIGSISVDSLEGSSSTVNKNSWRARVTVTLDPALENAVVTGIWTGGAAGTGTTNSSGVCVITSGNISTKVNSTTFTISNVTLAGYAFDPSGDSEVTVYKPGFTPPTPPPPPVIKPEVTFTSPFEGAEVSDSSVPITVNATITEGSIEKVEFFIDGSTSPLITDNDGTDGWNAVWDSTSVNDGSHTITAKATAASTGNFTEKTITVQVDNVADQNIQVTELTSAASWINKVTWKANVTVTLDQAINGAIVTGTWSDGSTGTGTTTNGNCTISSTNINKKVDTITFTITNVSMPGYVFDPSGPSSVTVNRP